MKVRRNASEKLMPAGVFFLAGVFLPIVGSAAPIHTVKVDCAQGRTIAHALGQGDERKPLVVQVRGTCNENVTIDRDDVTLQGDAMGGSTVNGPDPAANTINVTGSRVTIDGLTVTGGRNGITGRGARGMTVRNSVVENTGRTGIAYAFGASGSVDGATIQNNPRDGVVIESASATVTNSLITQNARSGVNIVDGASGRVGIDNNNLAAGNTISSNGSSGINLFVGSAAFIAGNTISGNGTNPTLGRSGIQVTSATATIVGGNTISGNFGSGIGTRSASIAIGDTSFGLSSVNTITGNGLAFPTGAGGVSGFLGSSFVIRDAVISGNTGSGVILSTNSTGQMFANTIQNNTGDGIRLVFGSGLLLATPNSSVTGNTGWGLNCTDGESSVVNTGFLNPVVPNTLGGVNPACTGF